MEECALIKMVKEPIFLLKAPEPSSTMGSGYMRFWSIRKLVKMLETRKLCIPSIEADDIYINRYIKSIHHTTAFCSSEKGMSKAIYSI